MIESLADELERSVNAFVAKLKPQERIIYSDLLVMLKDLSLYSDGTIKNSLENIKMIGKVQKKMEDVILTDDYLKSVSEFTATYTTVQKTANIYFSELNKTWTPKKVLAEVKNQAVLDAVDMLTETGISANVSTPIQNIIKINITSGGSYSTLTEQLRKEIVSTSTVDGALTKYARTYTTDAINTYSGTYMKMVTEDLGLAWFRYTGSIIKTSRPFCIALKQKKFIHKSEFAEILKGNIDGKKVSLSGVKKETTPDNFQQLRGGWQCGHQMIPISAESVPSDVREKIKSSAK